jgi:hypothetical protein
MPDSLSSRENLLNNIVSGNNKPGLINVYLCDSIEGAQGFAYYPDGSLGDYAVFLSILDLSASTLLHEIGHSLNLRHPHDFVNHLAPRCKQEASSTTRVFQNNSGCIGKKGKETSRVNGDLIMDTKGSPVCTNLPDSNQLSLSFDANGDGVLDDTSNLFTDWWGDPWNDEVFQYIMGYGQGESIVTNTQRSIMIHQIITGEYGKKNPNENNRKTGHRLNHDNIGFDVFEPNESFSRSVDESMQGAFTIDSTNMLGLEILNSFIQNGLVQMHNTFHVVQRGDRGTNSNTKYDDFDEDWFRLNVDNGLATTNPIRIFTSPAHGFPSCDTKLEVWIDNGSYTYKAYENDDHVATNNGYSFIELPSLISGNVYYIRVQKKSPVSTNLHDVAHYILNIEKCQSNIADGALLLNDKGIYHVNSIWDEINTDVAINGQIIIHSGAKLTINSTVEFMDINGPSIIVEPGGQLVLNSTGVLTSFNCGSNTTWRGIYLKGQPNLSQTTYLNQGYILIDGGTIKNAMTGIRVGNSRLWASSFEGGGIIIANNATFLNNKIDVEFAPYSRKVGQGKTYPNLSRFTNCKFLTDDNYYDQSNIDKSVKLMGVDNIKFYGCTFKDSRNIALLEQKRNGIMGLGSSITVSCTNKAPNNSCSGYKTEFIGLNTGIRLIGNGLYNNGADLPTTIELSNFDCLQGVVLASHNAFRAYSNDFRCTG